MNDLPLLIAFGAGILSFLAPCIFPLVPVTLVYISGTRAAPSRLYILRRTMLFALGFSLVFVASGALVGLFGFYLRSDIPWLEKIAGFLLIAFGLHLTGIIKIPLLYRQWALNVPRRNVGWLAPLFVGLSFGFGWSPCLGPVIGGILTLAYVSETALRGILLLVAYSIGLSIPFFVSALMAGQFISFLKRKKIARVLRWTEKLSGAFLITVGVLILTDTLIL